MTDASLLKQTGQLLLCGFEGTTMNPVLEQLIAKRHIGGVILFGRNYENPAQLWRLAQDIQRLALASGHGQPLFISVDQEGGRVSRLTAPFSAFPNQCCLGAARSEDLAFRFGKALSHELAAVGINMDYAPVLDVHTNPANPIIGPRALSADPEWVAKLGAAILRGFRESQVVPVGKHFPGHGDTAVDSHLDLPYVRKDAAALERDELYPFARLAKNELPVLMTAHVMYPAWDSQHPATFSRFILHDILRQRLGFDGIIMSDDLEMKAAQDRYSLASMAELGLNAGLDIFLICHSVDKIQELQDIIARLVETNKIPRARIAESLARIQRVKSGMPRPPAPDAPPDFNAWAAGHARLAAEMERFAAP